MDLITALNAAILCLNDGLDPTATSDEDKQWLDENSEAAVERLGTLRDELQGTKVTVNVL